MKFLFSLALSFLFCATANASLVTVIDAANGDNRIDTIEDLMITGTAFDGLYDLKFHYGIDFDELETIVASPITFTSGSDGVRVLELIGVEVRAFGDVVGTRTENIYIPRNDPGINVTLSHAENAQSTNYSGWYDGVRQNENFRQNLVFEDDEAFVTFTVADNTVVPEPFSGTAISVVGISALAYSYRRKKRKSKTKTDSEETET